MWIIYTGSGWILFRLHHVVRVLQFYLGPIHSEGIALTLITPLHFHKAFCHLSRSFQTGQERKVTPKLTFMSYFVIWSLWSTCSGVRKEPLWPLCRVLIFSKLSVDLEFPFLFSLVLFSLVHTLGNHHSTSFMALIKVNKRWFLLLRH